MKGPSAPLRLDSRSGLSVQLCANGSLRRMDLGDVLVNLFPGTEMEGGPANLYLRLLGDRIAAIPLLGPRAPAAFSLDARGFTTRGEWRSLRFAVSLRLAADAPAWFWHVSLENRGSTSESVDLVYAQDLALAHPAAVRFNEYYVSQYVDYTPLVHGTRGVVLAVRQNLPVGGRHPWAVLGSLERVSSFATDALQLHGLATRACEPPRGLRAEALPGRRCQHEHSMAVLQDAPVRIEPGAHVDRGFFGWLEAHHAAATSTADLVLVDRALALPEARPSRDPSSPAGGIAPAPTLFSACAPLKSLELDEVESKALFGENPREVEGEDGRVQSFFAGANRHVVLRAKELEVLRPHGHLLRTGDRLVPDEASLTSTTWMSGVFHSLLTQGHVGLNRFLSPTRSYLGLFRSPGQRVFVELAGGFQLLDVPSAYEMTPSGCRWIYKHAGGRIEVRSLAPVDRHELRLSIEVQAGAPCRFLVSHHVVVNGEDGADPGPVAFTRDGQGIAVHLRPDSELGRRFPSGCFRIDPVRGTALERVGGDELLFLDGRSRGQPFLALVTAPSTSFGLRITGELTAERGASAPAAEPASDQTTADRFWRQMTGGLTLHPVAGRPLAADVARLQEILPWLTHDALIHYLAPRGLEQYSGGAWGTRDVCQGPVELLLSLGRWEPVRDLLLRVFRAQNPDGDWPQWFMLFERERSLRAPDSHGDIVFWPVLALARYLLASGDADLLSEVVPFFDARGDERAEHATVRAHVERALEVMARRVIPGTQLAAYGNGDWNDSLQPADPSMCERLCSAWTVTLHHQTVRTLARALRELGMAARAQDLDAQAKRIRADFQRLLVADGVVAGYAYFEDGGRVTHLLHPRDATSGIQYSLLPMIHAITSDLFTPAQAEAHVGLIREHLLGPDGARLFDRPPPYRGGPQRLFQRAESSAFFGREIGIMYMHAHLRYAEAMARCGDAEAFFLALRQANPIGIRDVVASARPRQANCYTSSSDAVFPDRYVAGARYAEVKAGRIPLEGGWRVYSSGAGIAVHLIRECLLGLVQTRDRLVIDPVIPPSLDGLRAGVELAGRRIDVLYRIGRTGHGPTALSLNGQPLAFERAQNPYRRGGAAVPMAEVHPRLREGANTLVVELP